MESNRLSQCDMSTLAPSVTRLTKFFTMLRIVTWIYWPSLKPGYMQGSADATTIGVLTHGPTPSCRCQGLRWGGGGVAILFKSELNLGRMSISTFQSFELMEAKLTTGNRTFIFLVVYRPPSGQETTFLKEFAALIDSYITMAGHLILVGDFNMHWESPQKSCAVKLRDLLSAMGIT